MPTTTNYGWTYPTDGGSQDVWGDLLNDLFVEVDADVYALSLLVAARLPLAGGTLSGRLDTKTATAVADDLGLIAGGVSLDMATAQGFVAELDGAVTFTFLNAPAGLFGFTIKLANGAAGVTWPATVKWGAGAAPTLSAGTDILGFLTFDGGAIWYGVSVSLAAA